MKNLKKKTEAEFRRYQMCVYQTESPAGRL